MYARLLDKIEAARAALGGKVYDVLGYLFEAHALRELLIDAIRYGDWQEVREHLFWKVDDAAGQQQLGLIEERVLVCDTMSAAARRLQPFHSQSFSWMRSGISAAGCFGARPGVGKLRRCPARCAIATGASVQSRYVRICFEKERIDRASIAA